MIVISDSVALSTTESGGDVIDANNPVVGWRNVLTTSNVAADSADPNYPALNLANPATNLRWNSLTTATQYLTVSPGSGQIDYVGVARHNFGSALIPVSVEGYISGSWTQLTAPVLLPDDGPVVFRFSPQVLTQVRLKMGSSATPPRVAVMYVGLLLVLQRRIYVGHTPIPYGRSAVVTNSRSESGEFLGRVVLSESRATSVSLKNLTPDWYRAYLDPFVAASKDTPFFFAWRPSSYPLEVGYGWMTNDPKPVNQLNNGMMAIDLSMGGVS